MLIGAGITTGIGGIKGALVPHQVPASFTLAVLIGVVVIKEFLFRKVHTIGIKVNSHVVKTDAWHHRSDAISSAAAAVGIAIALIGGPAYAAADDWAALVAAFMIGANGFYLLRPAINELMDKSPGKDIENKFRSVALSVTGVKEVEKLKVRKVGTGYHVDIHIQMDGNLSLEDAHRISGIVKKEFRTRIPHFQDCSIHMEPLNKL
jgi:cation diffusion facilitator family transporter